MTAQLPGRTPAPRVVAAVLLAPAPVMLLARESSDVFDGDPQRIVFTLIAAAVTAVAVRLATHLVPAHVLEQPEQEPSA